MPGLRLNRLMGLGRMERLLGMDGLLRLNRLPVVPGLLRLARVLAGLTGEIVVVLLGLEAGSFRQGLYLGELGVERKVRREGRAGAVRERQGRYYS